jgi:hypothetical protein
MKDIVGEPHIRALGPHGGDRHQRATHVERKCIARHLLRAFQCVACAGAQLRRNQDDGTVAAKREGQFALRAGVRDRDDRRRAGKIDVLVAPGGDGGCRGDDIADSDVPLIRYADVVAGLERIGEVGDDGGVQDLTVQVLAGSRVC